MSSIEKGRGPDRTKSRIRQVYDEISGDFDRTRNRPWPETVEFVDSLTPPGLVLDLGCGNGKDTILLKKTGFSTVSLDLSDEQCKRTKDNLVKNGFPVDEKDTVVFQGDCEALPFDGETFDAVLFLATLHHLPTNGSRRASLLELRRVLKKGRTAFISVWDLDQPRFTDMTRCATEEAEEGDVLVPWKATEGKVIQRFYHLFRFQEFEQLITGIGFNRHQCFTSRGNHFARVEK